MGGNDTVLGNAGNDLLDGGVGADTMTVIWVTILTSWMM